MKNIEYNIIIQKNPKIDSEFKRYFRQYGKNGDLLRGQWYCTSTKRRYPVPKKTDIVIDLYHNEIIFLTIHKEREYPRVDEDLLLEISLTAERI